jgi:peptidoglycan hydrolase-like amidase
VRPGLKPGQKGLKLGDSGPYAVEELRLAAGRRFGWTTWPSNACEAEALPDGSLRLHGWGWGHNVGLCLATARFRAEQGATAEQILAEAYPASWRGAP